MDTIDTKKYLLVIKRDKNDYLPLEWFRCSFYEGENLNSLEGIDHFTSKITDIDLLNEGLNMGVIDLEDKYMTLTIIFFDNGKWREVKEGCVFANEITISDSEFIDVVMSYSNDKELMNNVSNIFNKGFSSEASKKLLFVFRNANALLEKGEQYLKIALETYNSMPYPERRKLRLGLCNLLVNRMKKDQMIYKKNNDII